MRRGSRTLLFIVYVLFALYFLNYGLNFIGIPESFSTFEQGIIFVGGILLLLGGINHLRVGRYSY
jgi:hypothetical protein